MGYFFVFMDLVLFDDGEDFIFGHNEVFFAIDFDFGAGVGGKDHSVVFFDLKFGSFSVFEEFTLAEGDNDTFFWFFFCGIGEDDSAFCFFFGFYAFDDDFVVERYDFCGHRVYFLSINGL